MLYVNIILGESEDFFSDRCLNVYRLLLQEEWIRWPARILGEDPGDWRTECWGFLGGIPYQNLWGRRFTLHSLRFHNIFFQCLPCLNFQAQGEPEWKLGSLAPNLDQLGERQDAIKDAKDGASPASNKYEQADMFENEIYIISYHSVCNGSEL